MRAIRALATKVVGAVLATMFLGACAIHQPGTTPSTPTVPVTSSAPSPSPSPSTGPSLSPSPSGSTSPDVAPSSSGLTLGPKGVGDVVLGMTRTGARNSDLVRTGLLHGLSSGNTGQCGASGDGWLGKKAPGEDAVAGRLFFSATTGKLVAIYAYAGLATPEGIKLGSPVAQVKAAYSDWKEEDGRGYPKVADNARATYRIQIIDGKVAELSLDAVDQDCYE